MIQNDHELTVMCRIRQYAADDGFVVTAYLTDQLKPGERLWRKK